jgi:hypothetical protein
LAMFLPVILLITLSALFLTVQTIV